ncbi:hypothetical protein SLEP1_g19705 [Rubroshorea leprosula]|uniref:UDP-glucuronosyl/UDP-glucosyltransferase n=1 Tax=Rubroshorea leprosula TaxID=152421 RepID=A0AAV5J094_9ROSI|nr:hypothetical protein SLEP1_g19705 [Rubroshorea leprosula]
MLQPGHILRSMGFSITIAHTKFYFPDPSDHPDFAFLPISDDLSHRDISSMDFISMFSSLNSSCKSPLLPSVTQIMEKQVHHDVLLCLIYDEFMYFAEAVAHELKLPSIILTTGSAANLLISPLHKIASTSTSSSAKEDRRCIEWLDKQTLNSVLYVSLGSIASVTNKDIREMAEDLANSRQPFLWVLRPGSILLEDFNEIVKDRGYIMN